MNHCAFDPVYEITSRTTEHEDYGSCTDYGIRCRRKDAHSGEERVWELPGITTDRDLVEDMHHLFTKCRLAPDQFKSVVMGILS